MDTRVTDLPEILLHLGNECRYIAEEHGFHTGEREPGTLIALMHSELSEALEALRHGNPPDDKIPKFSGVEAEFADCIIRMLDYASLKHMDLGSAILAKIDYNRERPYQHGGKKF